jgi:hypothetical protein
MVVMQHLPKPVATLCGLVLLTTSSLWAADLPDPDGKPADMSKPVKVFLILGQSNAVGLGSVTGDKPGSLETAVKTGKLYPFLVDDAGNWAERKDVRNVQVMVGRGGGMSLLHNDWMTVKGRTMGVEYGVGHQLGNALDEPVMVLKSCIGNRSLGWDLLPPGSKRFLAEITDKSGKYPGFKGNVATVYTHPMARGGGGNGHYGKDSRVYMDVGLAMGQAMNELLKNK